MWSEVDTDLSDLVDSVICSAFDIVLYACENFALNSDKGESDNEEDQDNSLLGKGELQVRPIVVTFFLSLHGIGLARSNQAFLLPRLVPGSQLDYLFYPPSMYMLLVSFLSSPSWRLLISS
jgi:hypothetical protein